MVSFDFKTCCTYKQILLQFSITYELSSFTLLITLQRRNLFIIHFRDKFYVVDPFHPTAVDLLQVT